MKITFERKRVAIVQLSKGQLEVIQSALDEKGKLGHGHGPARKIGNILRGARKRARRAS